jgi:hypothetical protein
MKITNLLIIGFGSSLILFMATEAKSQINLQTGKTRIQTNSSGGMSISTDRTQINVSGENTTINTDSDNFHNWDDYYFDEDDYSFDNHRLSPHGRQPRSINEQTQQRLNSRMTCYQENRQTTKIVGSNRTVEQTSTSNCP